MSDKETNLFENNKEISSVKDASLDNLDLINSKISLKEEDTSLPTDHQYEEKRSIDFDDLFEEIMSETKP